AVEAGEEGVEDGGPALGGLPHGGDAAGEGVGPRGTPENVGEAEEGRLGVGARRRPRPASGRRNGRGRGGSRGLRAARMRGQLLPGDRNRRGTAHGARSYGARPREQTASRSSEAARGPPERGTHPSVWLLVASGVIGA